MKISVIGDGGWGTALAVLLHRNGHEVTVWGPFEENIIAVQRDAENKKFLAGVEIPQAINWTSDRRSAVADADMVTLVVPSRFYEDVVSSFAGLIPDNIPLVSATKGLDEESQCRMSELSSRILGRDNVVVLSGPSHAEEVARGLPTTVVAASRDHAEAEKVQAAFTGDDFRVYTSEDVVGVELGGILKNVIALAAGISDGMGLGDNAKAGLITRGLAEMSRLGSALGARPETFSGLSGLGDLVVTCASRHSRNRSVGEQLGRGHSLEEIMATMEMVAEGVWNCSMVCSLADKVGVDVPIASEVSQIVHCQKNPRRAMEDLMGRDPRPEPDGCSTELGEGEK